MVRNYIVELASELYYCISLLIECIFGCHLHFPLVNSMSLPWLSYITPMCVVFLDHSVLGTACRFRNQPNPDVQELVGSSHVKQHRLGCRLLQLLEIIYVLEGAVG